MMSSRVLDYAQQSVCEALESKQHVATECIRTWHQASIKASDDQISVVCKVLFIAFVSADSLAQLTAMGC